MSQGWILPDGSMSSNEMEYNTPWLFEDPISDDLPQAAGTRSAFVDPRVAAVSKTGALTDYINAVTGSSGTNTPWVPGKSAEWSGGLGLPSWAANGLVQAGKFGLGAMGAPSFITGPLGALASSFLGDENSTAESVRNKVGNSIIGAGLSALNPIAGITNSVLGAFGFDAMRGLTNLNSPDPEGGGTKAGFWSGTRYGPGVYGGVGSLSTEQAMAQAPTTEYVSGLQSLPIAVNQSAPSYMGSSGGFNQPSTSSGGGWTSASSGSAYSSPSGYSGYSYSGPGSSTGTGGSDDT